VQLKYPAAPLLGDGLRIRPWRSPDDLPCVRAAASDPEIPAGTTVPAVFTEAAGRAFLDRQQARLTRGEGISQAVAEHRSDRPSDWCTSTGGRSPGSPGSATGWSRPPAAGDWRPRWSV
jgi:hypothetical protein